VGQADAALVLCDGKTMLIDGGNKADSNLIYTYLKKHNITHLDYIIGTHAHEDHIGGIPGALQIATVDTVYCPATSYTSQAFKNFASAVQKQGKSITVPNKGLTFNLGSATCTILAVNTDKKDPNNSSIVMRIVYGETSFLFTGDAEREVEQALLNSGVTLKSDVLKVGHHGSETSTSYAFLREIMPQYAVISVGKGNTYGHPTDAVLSRLRDADVTTFRTDLQGDILCISDGKTVTFTPSRNANVDVYAKIGPNSTQ
jgi:competence protein ComEC